MSRVKIDPVVWKPPRAGARSRQSASAELLPPLTLLALPGVGPEDVVVGSCGEVYTGLADGRVVRVDPESGEVTKVGDTHGRPLGLEVLPDGRLLVCDSHRGLLRLDPSTGDVECLVEQVDGQPLVFASNVVAASDGTIYFTESSTRFHIEDWKAAIVEHRSDGRLFRLDTDGTVEVLLDGLSFANGLVLTPDEAVVIVAETGTYQLTRLRVTGPGAGTKDVLIGNLPGSPDNLSIDADGTIWVALASARDARLDRLLAAPPVVRRLVMAVPERLQPAVRRTVWVLGVDLDGRIVRDLQGSGGDFAMTTGVVRRGDRLYLGSLIGSAVAVLDLGGT